MLEEEDGSTQLSHAWYVQNGREENMGFNDTVKAIYRDAAP